MVRARYVAKKVGDQYVLIPQGPEQELARGMWALGGLLTSVVGFRRGGMSGLIMTLLGGGMIWRGVTGCNPLGSLGSIHGHRSGAPQPTPSHRHDWKQTGQVPADETEEASMESFPASDPPASTKKVAAD